MEVVEEALTISKHLITIDRKLKIGTPVTLVLEGEIYSDKNIPNHDGTGLVHINIFRGEIATIKEDGKVINEDKNVDI